MVVVVEGARIPTSPRVLVQGGRLPIHAAVLAGSECCVRLLLGTEPEALALVKATGTYDAGQVNAADSVGKTPLRLAIERVRCGRLARLPRPRARACAHGLKATLRATSRSHDCCSSSRVSLSTWPTPCTCDARRCGWTSACVAHRGCGSAGMTPLHAAAERGDAKMLQLLLNAPAAQRADVALQSSDKQTALHYACAAQSVECVKLLVEAGVPLNTARQDGA